MAVTEAEAGWCDGNIIWHHKLLWIQFPHLILLDVIIDVDIDIDASAVMEWWVLVALLDLLTACVLVVRAQVSRNAQKGGSV